MLPRSCQTALLTSRRHGLTTKETSSSSTPLKEPRTQKHRKKSQNCARCLRPPNAYNVAVIRGRVKEATPWSRRAGRQNGEEVPRAGQVSKATTWNETRSIKIEPTHVTPPVYRYDA